MGKISKHNKNTRENQKFKRKDKGNISKGENQKRGYSVKRGEMDNTKWIHTYTYCVK